MNALKHLALAFVAGACFVGAAAPAQARVAVAIGAAPNCPYGYYDYPPYVCAPSGYYGPEWFDAGVFIGVGPWFHGRRGFRGQVDNRFDVRHGYAGPRPNLGDSHDHEVHVDHMAHFRGNEMHASRGWIGGGGRR